MINKEDFIIKVGNDFEEIKSTNLPIMDRYSTGSAICKGKIDDCFVSIGLIDSSNNIEIEVKEEEVETIDITLDEVDEQILTIDDFLNDFNI